jgi:hypothetical protein
LFLICDFPEFLRIHAEFSRHLDMDIRKTVSFSNINPYLILFRYLIFLTRVTPLVFFRVVNQN